MTINSVHLRLNAVKYAINQATDMLVTTHQVGWFDGGCYTLAKWLNDLFGDEALIFHISRSKDCRDHAVVYFKSLGKYFDADGLQTEAELFHKMKNTELVDVKYLLSFTDIDEHTVYHDIFNALSISFKEKNDFQIK